jgi:hypothetical protein
VSPQLHRILIVALLVVMALLGVAAAAAHDWLYVVVDVAAVAYLAVRLRQHVDPPAD